MKVYIIRAQRVNSSTGIWFNWNVYSSLEKAIEVYKRITLDDRQYVYCINEYDVID